MSKSMNLGWQVIAHENYAGATGGVQIGRQRLVEGGIRPKGVVQENFHKIRRLCCTAVIRFRSR